jgi:hypothetical protein
MTRSAGCADRSPREPKPRELPEIGDPELTIANVIAWAKAEAATKLLGDVPLPVIEARTRACLTGGPGGEPCPWLRQKRSSPDRIGYCGACGCGSAAKAALSRKVTMRAVERPKPCLWES